MFEAAFGARGSQPALSAAQGFANGTFINLLNTGEAGGLANALAGSPLYLCRMVGSALSPCGRLGYDASGPYPINVFQVNPYAAGRSLFLMADDGSYTNYNGMQVEFRRRYAKGLTFAVNYAFSKAGGNLFADSDGARRNYSTLRNRPLDNGPSPFDLRHALQAYYTLELPFGRDHRLSTNNGVLDRVIGGWSISGITRWQQGRVFRLVSGRNTLNQRPAGVILNGITPDQLQKMINVQAGPSGSTVLFVDPALIGSDGRANPQYLLPPTTPGDLGSYVFLHGPATLLTDLALLKDIDLKSGMRLSFWVEALNAFNSANFLVGSSLTNNAPGPDVNITSTTFGQTSIVGTPRNVQLRVRFSF